MIKLLIKVSFLFIIVLSICYSALFLNPKYEFHYLSSIKQKLKKLEKIEGQKIVIIGGSNACFGIDSELMENSLGIPVVNTALHAALGPNFWIEYVKENLNEGDILIMSPEYGMLARKGWYGTKSTTVPITISYTPSKLYIYFKNYIFFKKNTVRLFETIKSYWKEYPFEPYDIQGTYDIRSFEIDNIKGDYINSVYKGKETKTELDFNESNVSWRELKNAKEYFDNKNIKFYFHLPSALDESFDVKKAKKFIKSISEYSQVPILNNNYDYFFKRKYFFDTEYHLNKTGRELRTKMLIDDINQELSDDIIKKEVKTNKVFLSKSNYVPIDLDQVKMAYKIKQKRFGSDSIIVSAETDDKLGFLKYKSEAKDYNGYLFKVTVRAKSDLINKLKFRSATGYDFDFIQKKEDNIYVLCKVLSNTINSPKGNKENASSSIGIGFNKGALSLSDEFVVLKFELIKTAVECEEVSGDIAQNEYIIDSSIKSVIFKFKNFNKKEFKFNDVINIDSQKEIISNNKYSIKIESNTLFLYDFYRDKLLYKGGLKTGLKFINSKDYQIEINY